MILTHICTKNTSFNLKKKEKKRRSQHWQDWLLMSLSELLYELVLRRVAPLEGPPRIFGAFVLCWLLLPAAAAVVAVVFASGSSLCSDIFSQMISTSLINIHNKWCYNIAKIEDRQRWIAKTHRHTRMTNNWIYITLSWWTLIGMWFYFGNFFCHFYGIMINREKYFLFFVFFLYFNVYW